MMCSRLELSYSIMAGIGVIMAGIEITTENYRKWFSQWQSKKVSCKKIADPHGMIILIWKRSNI